MIPNHKLPVRWDFNNQTMREISGQAQTQFPGLGRGLQYRMLVGGRVMEVSTVQGGYSGRYRCQTLLNSTRQILSAWIDIRSDGEHLDVCVCVWLCVCGAWKHTYIQVIIY